MRILHVLDHSLPLHSGYSFRTLAILREQRALGWETVQLTTPRQRSKEGTAESVEGWVFHRTAVPDSRWPPIPGLEYITEMGATERRLEALVREFQPAIIHAHSPVLNALPALRVGRRTGVAVVYEVRALWEDAAVDHGTTREGGLRYRASRALETFALRHADQITTICEGLRNEISGRGIPSEKITVIPNGVDTQAFRVGAQPDPELRRQLGLESGIVIGFAGSFYAYEGLDLLIEAMSLIARSWPDAKLLLIGGGPQKAALERQAAGLGLGERVLFTGRVPHGEMQRYYDLIDMLAYPRRSMRLTELVTPLKPLEAMAQGRIVIASDVGGHRELIRDRETGVLCRAGDATALADALRWALANRDAWPAIQARARTFVEAERTWTKSVRRYGDVYRRLRETEQTARGV